MFDCIIIGGGIAGLQAAIQLGRYEYRVLVIDSGTGRSTLCRRYRNILGWPAGVAGDELRRLGRIQADTLGVHFVTGNAGSAGGSEEEGFFVTVGDGADKERYRARTLLLATGIMDRLPPVPGLRECLGLTLYVCPDCDGYEVRNRRTVIIGAGNTGAEMALTIRSRTDALIYINHDLDAIDDDLHRELKQNGIPVMHEQINEIAVDGDGEMIGVKLVQGGFIEAERGFVAFGGNAVHTDLATELGVERLENKHIPTDPRSKMTNVSGVWAIGDIGVHSEQATIAMGEGAQAAIWIHKSLVRRRGS